MRSVTLCCWRQNNQWAISTPTALQSRTPLHQRANGFGLRTFHVDGNDALAMYAVTKAAADLVRSGEGPALIEAETFRMAGHSTSDDPTKYRDPAELDLWTQRDPLVRLRHVLESMDTPREFFDELDEETQQLAVEVRTACRALADPDLGDLFAQVYSEPHATVEADYKLYRTFTESLRTEA